MAVHLSPQLVDKLLALPEDGMGYQIVDLVIDDGRVLPRVVVLNADTADLEESAVGGAIVDVRMPPGRG